ncbi:MAG TPA: hypothetical protein VL403_19480, partial [Candidatus Kryptonia bacterium]|nr:hypothetical protein [Candidatus Kryptonia bacterium]
MVAAFPGFVQAILPTPPGTELSFTQFAATGVLQFVTGVGVLVAVGVGVGVGVKVGVRVAVAVGLTVG